MVKLNTQTEMPIYTVMHSFTGINRSLPHNQDCTMATSFQKVKIVTVTVKARAFLDSHSHTTAT